MLQHFSDNFFSHLNQATVRSDGNKTRRPADLAFLWMQTAVRGRGGVQRQLIARCPSPSASFFFFWLFSGTDLRPRSLGMDQGFLYRYFKNFGGHR
jgi:hypothetical protein